MSRYYTIIAVLISLFAPAGDAQEVAKQVVRFEGAEQNLLQRDRFRPFETGFQYENGIFICDNGTDTTARRGVAQTVMLNQTQPEPIVAEAWSRAENVSGTPSADYALYIDLVYTDGTPLWGQTAAFATGTHDWHKRTLTILPQKPVRSLTMYVLFRNKSGKASFRDMRLSVLSAPEKSYLFDGVPVIPKKQATLQIRDVAANSDFFELRGNSLGVNPTVRQFGQMTQVTLVNSDAQDRCLTLVYSIAVPPEGLTWCVHPRSDIAVEPNSEYVLTTSMPGIGSNGRLSLYPFAAVAKQSERETTSPILPPYPVGPGGSGSLYCLAINPQDQNNFFITCDMTSAFGTTDGGNSFDGIHLLGTPRWFFSPYAETTVYATSGTFSYVSQDKGKSWDYLFPRREDIAGITTDPFLGQPFVKRDAIRPSTLLLCVYAHPTDPNTIYAVSQGNTSIAPTIYRTTDAGRNWQEFAVLSGGHIGNAAPLSHVLYRYITMVLFNGELHVMSNRGFYKLSLDGTEISHTPKANASGALWVEGNSLTAYVNVAAPDSDLNYSQYIEKTNDFGASFRRISDNFKRTAKSIHSSASHATIPDRHRVQFRGVAVSGNAVYVTFTGSASSGSATYAMGVARTTNDGATWEWILDGFNDQEQQFTSLGPVDVWTGSVAAWGVMSDIAVAASDPNHAIIANSRDTYETKDGGRSWRGLSSRRTDDFGKTIPNLRTGDPAPFWTTTGIEPAGQMTLAINPFNQHHHLAGWTDTGIFESFDAGQTWTQRSLQRATAASHPSPGLGAETIGANNCTAIAFDPLNEGIILAAFPGTQRDSLMYHSIRGFTLSSCECDWRNPHEANCPCRPYTPTGGVRYFDDCACQRQGYVMRSTDGGKNWTRVMPGARLIPTAIVFDPNTSGVVYMSAMGVGILKSIDSGITWQEWNDGIDIQTSTIAGTLSGNIGGGRPDRTPRHGRGILKLTLGKDNKTLFALTTTGYQIEDVSWGIGTLDAPTYQLDMSNSANGWTALNRPTPTALFSVDQDASGTLYAVPITQRMDRNSREDFNGADIPIYRNGGAFVSTDNGNSWRQMLSESINAFIIRTDSRRSNVLYMTTGIGAFTSNKGKDTTLNDWVRISGFDFRSMHENIYENPIDPTRFYVTTWGGGTWSMPLVEQSEPKFAGEDTQGGIGVGIDLKTPAFFRTGYHSGTSELYVAVDVALTRESPITTINFVRFSFDPKHTFRGALDAYYRLFPSYFASRTPEQGTWMPFTRISTIPHHEDFGFKFKEGHDETAWDDEHDILTFRYTEPGTWWMALPESSPFTYEGALEEAGRLAANNNPRALALFKSGMHDAEGQLIGRLSTEPWLAGRKGIVWSINDMPEIEGGSFSLKWNPQIFERYYLQTDREILDGEYVDSAEGYVTAPLDFKREHFAAARTPLVFTQETHQPAIFKGLVFFEYVRSISEDMRRHNKLMFANSTPYQLCWLVPWFDILGTETDWNPGGQWSPAADATMLYRRALSGQKPYCFLMNTDFTQFPYELSERFMKRSLAYGMFPGFFSADASTNTYFSQPELYERDRPLFQKYVPLCKLIAEAGWCPLTFATSSEPSMYIERFGSDYFTVFNDSQESRTTILRFEKPYMAFNDLVSGKTETLAEGVLTLPLEPEGVALLEPVQ